MKDSIPKTARAGFRLPIPRLKPRSRMIALIAAVGCLAGGMLVAKDDVKPVVVTSAEQVKGMGRDFSLTGTVTSPRRAELSSRMEGLVSMMAVDAGGMVKKGDVLMQLDTRLAEIDLELIEAQINQAEIETADAQREVDEVATLLKTGGFPKSQGLARDAALAIRKASLKQLEARKSKQLEEIARHKLVAPFDGIISEKMSEAGEWVATGDPVLELVEMKNLRFDLQIPQEFLGRVNDVGRVSVRLDAYPDTEIEAELSVVVPVKNAVSRTFLTRLILKDPKRLAGPGMSGTATLESRPPPGTTVQVLRDAVVRFPDGTARVWVIEKNGLGTVAVSRVVETAGALGEMAEIIKGLDGGETVILKGNEGLQENQKVKPLTSPEVSAAPKTNAP